MEESEFEKYFRELLNKNNPAYFLANAMLEDYANEMAKLSNQKPEEIIKRILNKATVDYIKMRDM